MHDTPPDLLDELSATSRDESDAVFGSPWTLDTWPDRPTRVVAGRDDRFFPADFQARIARDRLGLEPLLMPGGHLMALSHPVELTDLIEQAE